MLFHRFYSDDAASGNKGYRAAGYTIELRDRGQYAFLLPPDQVYMYKQWLYSTVVSMNSW